MAKKGQVQLQAEITNEDEWEKFLQKDGLLLVDVFSDWCGPCQGMSANLKKLKLEVGGDTLQLAMAKCDNIEQLERFRNKSEPTWMFISKGKMVNLMFGADAPKLTRLILDELKKETMAMSGERERDVVMEITDLTEEEQARVEAAESIKRAAKEREDAKKAKELLERRTAECKNLLTNLTNLGTILIFPNARNKYKEVLHDLIQEAGLDIQMTEKVKITEEILEKALYFSDTKLPPKTMEDIFSNQLSLALLIKRISDSLPGKIDEIVLQVVYGNCRKPPGDERSASQSLTVKTDDENDDNTLVGLWAPPNSLAKVFTLKYVFPNLCAPFLLPESVPTPLYVAVGYDAFKSRDIMELSTQYVGQVMSYGFFTSDIPAEAQLIAKTVEQFEARTTPTTYDEKIVIQLAKINPECLMAFAELGPSYMSLDGIVGEMDCKIFFPPGYNEPEVEVTTIKKKTKKKGKKAAAIVNKEASITTSEMTTDQNEIEHIEDENEDQESDEEKPGDSAEGENDALAGADKATSPLHEEKGQE